MKMYSSLKERLETINKKGFIGKGTTTFIILMLGLFIATIFTVSLLPTIISNLTGYGLQNISLGNGSLCIQGEAVGAGTCILSQTTGASSVFVTVIIPLFVIFAIFFLFAQKMGFGTKGFGGK